ncbi:DUF4350 domain-containing protein [Microbacterium sp. C5A9]|uniref:DUF4350 domain-containing protein n=1 Tax=Microbacterium sp. C5A9 TaxID=2736663 RepID=UPI001F52698E|nr:DUF4350 domain-containing protein [Microbacterium sp. C5A9]MCI1017645.1 DUF4350 domain-containing protein [Microbacterium sp. C5A9]
MTIIEEHETPTSTAERPAHRRRLTKLGGWAAVVALVLGGVFVATQVGVQMPDRRGALDPESVADSGTMALAEILRDQGVEVDVHRSRADARAALDDDATLVMANPFSLSDDAIMQLVEPADRVVFLSSSTHLLSMFDLGTNASPDSAPVSAQCDIPEFANVGSIRPDRLFAPADGVDACFGSDEAAAVLVDADDDTTRIVVEGARLFSNAALAEDGNAALGLALLGQSDRVVWYVPSFADSDIEGDMPDSLGSLTPGWVTPAILLLMLSGVAAALWRGQRFGPLVAETLPVTVRASETMHGRARLTAKAADAGHAAEALRDGSLRRVARRLGLAERARPDEVADAAADRLRIPRGSLHELLAGRLPNDDADLVAFARRLSELEDAVDATTHELRGRE